ncbi:MAG: DMT family transporter [Deltaproteobacteria bacterium]|nr:DMT family transporter [Deltaproteobacteria bacterium]
MSQQSNWTATAQLVAAMALAGSSVVVGKGLANTLPVFLTTAATLMVALVVLLPCAWRRRAEISALETREWLYLFLQGFFGIVLFRVLMLHGLRTVGAAQAGIITGTSPAVLTILSWLMMGERPTALSGVCLLCTITGATGIALADRGGVQSGGFSWGMALIFGAVVSEGLFSIWRKRIAATVPATTNTVVLVFCALLAVLPMALVDLLRHPVAPTSADVAAILYYGAVATVAAYILWTGAVGSVSGVTAGIATAAMPASAVALSALVLNQPLSLTQLCGCLLVMLGIVAGAWSARGE